jgi:hypothetical protein
MLTPIRSLLIGHLLFECHVQWSQYPRPSSVFLPQRYTRDPGCLPLDADANFIALLSAIRHHLYTSTYTAQCYVSIAREFQRELGSHFRGPQPSLRNFRDFVAKHWPTFRSFEGPANKVLWGRVSKREGSPLEVSILSGLVSAAEVVSQCYSNQIYPN